MVFAIVFATLAVMASSFVVQGSRVAGWDGQGAYSQMV